MGNFNKRVLSFVLALLLLCSLIPFQGIEAQAATVNYVYNGQYLYNWGSRGTIATFMSPNALAFYEDNNVSLDSLANLSGSASTGSVPSSALYKTLKTLMTNNHSNKTSYDETKSLYKYTDCQGGGGKISSFYSGNAIGPEWGNGWNREHTWPNSKGLGGQDENDIMMLRPTSTSENSSRGNTAYGKSSGYYNPNNESGGRYNLHGDVARIMLYTYVRWGNTSKMWGSGGVMESREVLLEWMEEDPVDTWELGRNDAVEAITGTRNVFVDYPELAFVMFGSEIPANYTSPSGGISSSVSYEITATSNNTAWGTVSVAGRTVTATPVSGYEVSGYELLSGTATVSRTGNQFILSPSTDVSVRINFSQKVAVPTVSEMKTGDQVVIYAPAYNKALTSETVATHYLAGVDITEANGAVTGYGSTALWTVTANTDGTYSFSYGSQKLGMADEYTSMKLGEAHNKWALVALGDGLYKVQNTVRGNYMEWYASKDNWSTFTSASDSQFHISFYVVGKGIYNGASSAPETPNAPDTPVTPPDQPGAGATATKLTDAPYDGDVVVIYNSQKALSANASGSALAAVAASVSGDTLTITGDMAQLTVGTDGTYYTFQADGKYLTSGATGKALSFSATLNDYSRWTIASAGNGAWYITNVGAAYNGNHNQALEYYSNTFTTYGIQQTGIYQMQLFKVDEKPEPELPVEVEKLTAPVVKKDGQKLTWNDVEHADYYEIYRATKKSGKYTLIANQPFTYYEDIAVAAKTYYYKVKAVYEADETKNSDLSKYISLARKCDAPAVETTQDEDSGKPIVVWDKVVGAKKYTVYRATSETGKYKKLGTTSKLYYTDTKASVGTTYFYKVVANASSSKYNSGYSSIDSITCICARPSMTVKIDANTGKATISWKKVTGAVSYRVFRDGDIIATVTTLSYADTTAAIDTEYGYQVQALGKTENLYGQLCASKFVTTGMAKPKVKGSIDANGKPVLNWDAVEGAVKYEIYRSTKSSKSYKLLTTVEAPGYIDETVSAGKTYYYKVKAIGQVSESADSSYVKLTGKCAATELFVENAASGKPQLSWYKVAGAKKYTVYRATSETGKYTKLGTTKKLSYTDTKAKSGAVYFYKVVVNGSKSSYNSIYSNIVSCGVTCAAPKVTLKQDGKTGNVVASWGKVTGAVQYKVTYQMAFLGAGYAPEPHVEFTTGTSYTITGAAVDELVKVQVEAIAADERYNSVPSQEKDIEVAPATPAVAGKVGANGKPVISWEKVDGAVIYKIYRSTKKSSGYKLVGEVEDMSESEELVPEFEDATAKKGKTYYYKVVASGWMTDSLMSSYVKVKSK